MNRTIYGSCPTCGQSWPSTADPGVTEAMVVAATKASAERKTAGGGSYSRMHAAITAALRAQRAES